MNSLPNELLTKIISYLPNNKSVALVNRRFYDAVCVLDAKHMYLGIYRQCMSVNCPCYDFITRVMNTTRPIRNIMVSFLCEERTVVIGVLKKFAQDINYLRVCAGNATDLIEAIELVPNVVHLELVFLPGHLPFAKKARRDDSNGETLNLLRLKKLQIDRCQHEFVGMFNRLPAGVLTELILRKHNLNELLHLLKTQRNITSLTIRNCECDCDCEAEAALIDTDIFENLRLEHLQCDAYDFLHGNFCTILTKQRDLRTLKLFGTKIRADLLNVITNHLDQLQTLAIGITHLPAGAIRSVNKLVHLTDLTLQSEEFEDEANSLKVLREFAAQDNTRITTLNIQHCFDIPHDLIETMARSLPNLKMVTIHCDYVINTFNAILKSFNYVEALHLDASDIDYEAKDRLGSCNSLVKRSCDNYDLTELRIDHPMAYSIKMIEKMVACYPHLKRLVIFPTNRNFPAPFEAILKGFKELESLFILRSLMQVKKRFYDLDVVVTYGVNLKFVALLDLELKDHMLSSIKENVRRKFGAIEYNKKLGLKMADGRATMKTEWEYVQPF